MPISRQSRFSVAKYSSPLSFFSELPRFIFRFFPLLLLSQIPPKSVRTQGMPLRRCHFVSTVPIGGLRSPAASSATHCPDPFPYMLHPRIPAAAEAPPNPMHTNSLSSVRKDSDVNIFLLGTEKDTYAFIFEPSTATSPLLRLLRPMVIDKYETAASPASWSAINVVSPPPPVRCPLIPCLAPMLTDRFAPSQSPPRPPIGVHT